MQDYRARIFKRCSTNFQGGIERFDLELATRWGKAYDFYFRGWLPENKDVTIVDLACGSGRLLHFFKQRGYSKLCGVDISPEQVNLAQQVIPDVHQENILNFLKSRIDAFDLITGLDIIEHLQKDEVFCFLDLCYQSLKNKGRLILQTPNAESPFGNSVRYGDFSHETCFNSNALLHLMQLCKFLEVEAREQGPVPFGYSIVSTVRFILWQSIRMGLKIWNIAETGGYGSGVFTRVFLVTGLKT